MAFATQNDWAAGRKPAITPSDMTVCAPRFEQPIEAADKNAIGVVGILPAGCVPALQMITDAHNLTGKIEVGILDEELGELSHKEEDGAGKWAFNVEFQAETPTLIEASIKYMHVKPVPYDRKIAVKGVNLTPAGDGAYFCLTVPYCAR